MLSFAAIVVTTYAESLQVWTQYTPRTSRGCESGVQRGLFLRRRKRPGRPRATLLAEDEAHLLRRLQLRLVGTEGGAGLGQVQRTEKIATEETFLTTHFASGSLTLRSLHLPPPCADR
jgi:hypothetical protein